jgi:DNA polymerase V
MNTRVQLRFFTLPESGIFLPYVNEKIRAGFPSPALDYMENELDLLAKLVKHKAATFCAEVTGDSMKDVGIRDKDIIIIDRAVEPFPGCVAVCSLDGEHTLKILDYDDKSVSLIPANEEFKTIEVKAEQDFSIWGVVVRNIQFLEKDLRKDVRFN